MDDLGASQEDAEDCTRLASGGFQRLLEQLEVPDNGSNVGDSDSELEDAAWSPEPEDAACALLSTGSAPPPPEHAAGLVPGTDSPQPDVVDTPPVPVANFTTASLDGSTAVGRTLGASE